MVRNSGPKSPGSKDSTFNNNLSELDSLLDDLNCARIIGTNHRPNNQFGVTNGNSSSGHFGRGRSDSTQVNQLIHNLEHNLHNPQHVMRGHQIKPITITKYYEEETTTESARPQLMSSSAQQPQHGILSSPKHAGTASNATRELDDLMASLSDFKMKEKPISSDYGKVSPKPSGQHLDSMLGTLQSDMSRHGVDTAAKGHCQACHKPIVGQVVTALGKTWHPEHFQCVHCGIELGTKNFFERDSEPYCETDYHNLFSPRCAYCNASILDKCITALDKTWHPEHFFCAHCGKSFGDDGYHEKDGRPFCREDYFELFAPKCGGCNTAITDNYISALSTQWHPECFVCRDCRSPFNGGSFFDHEGQPYCEVHYHAKRGSLCAGCHKPITGRCITAMYRKFHPEHFVCSFCLKQLNKGTFKEQSDKPYCHSCFEKLFA
jgi:paxillin